MKQIVYEYINFLMQSHLTLLEIFWEIQFRMNKLFKSFNNISSKKSKIHSFSNLKVEPVYEFQLFNCLQFSYQKFINFRKNKFKLIFMFRKQDFKKIDLLGSGNYLAWLTNLKQVKRIRRFTKSSTFQQEKYTH